MARTNIAGGDLFMSKTVKAYLNAMFTELYQVFVGKSGGNTLVGGTDASDTLVLMSTADETKGDVGINTASPETSSSGVHVGGDTLRIDTARTPSSASDTGKAGEVCWDADYVYVCVATDTWTRAAIATWS